MWVIQNLSVLVRTNQDPQSLQQGDVGEPLAEDSGSGPAENVPVTGDWMQYCM